MQQLVQEEIGKAAGDIWSALNTKGELTLQELKKQVGGESPVFDWAIGWLAREDKLAISREKRKVRICLRGYTASPAASAQVV